MRRKDELLALSGNVARLLDDPLSAVVVSVELGAVLGEGVQQ